MSKRIQKNPLREVIKEIEEEKNPEPLVEIFPDGSIKPCERISPTKTCKRKDCSKCPVKTILKEIKNCKFRCKDGSLEFHRGYIALVARAEQLQAKLEKCEENK